MTEQLSAVLDDIVRTLERFIVLPEHGADAIALYVAYTFLASEAQFAPMLVLTSPEMRCGKTTTMDLVGELVHEPLGASNASPAALYRVIEERAPTLLLDEVDAFLAQKSEASEAVRSILNSGHRRGKQSGVLRLEPKGNDFELRRFSTFCPKVLAGIGSLHATLRDRSITIRLRRKRPDEQVERLRVLRVEEELTALRDRIAAAAEPIRDEFAEQLPEAPEQLGDRAADNWEHLLAIADLAGEKWPERAREAAVEFSTESDENESARVLLLGDIREYFAETGFDVVPTADLLAHLNDIETRPWCTWHRDKPMDARDLAKLLAPFGVQPTQAKVDGNKVRGYRRIDFDDAFARYLTPDSENAGTTVRDTDNSPQQTDLTRYHTDSGTGYSRYRDGEEYQGYPVPEKDRYRDNSLSKKEITSSGTTVPAKSDPEEDEEGYRL